MKKLSIVAVLVAAALAGVAFYSGTFSGESASATSTASGKVPTDGGQGRAGGAAGQRGGGGGTANFAAGRAPLTVEVGQVTRRSVAEQITVVGNLIGDATVSVAPRAAGRLEEIGVRLGDRVSRGQKIAKLEDFELLQQVKQAEAAQEVSVATIRQREAELKLAETNVERSRNLYQRQLLPKQTLDDNESRYNAALAQLDLAKAQSSQTKARLEELKITLDNTIITSPLNGLVAKRAVDPGAFVSQNVPVVDVVDVGRVRLVANVVEKDLKELHAGNPTRVQVDAYPGETFAGRIARVSPVLDPTTRTAPIEIEIPNPDYRLKPGMYARVSITTGTKKDALVVPANAVVDLGGRRGVFQPQNGQAVFRVVDVGLEQPDLVEVRGGLSENETVITTGSAALRDGDRILLSGQDESGGRRESGAARAGAGRSGDGSSRQ
jgi:RND family efflux transporter MFP subunit